ncbi:hypothetical protein MYOV024v1_p0006 [Vibrio phage PS34B.2]|nr:hypothetical protein MYOV024v1_p0006 [Vibrio phage PS34B.2]
MEMKMAIEKISINEWLVTGNLIADRKFIITKPTENYRVEIFKKRSNGGKPYFGRLIIERGNLKYFKTRELAEAFIKRQDFNC